MLRQIEWYLQNDSVTKNGDLPVSSLFVLYSPIFVLFVSAGVLFDGTFSLWVSLNISQDSQENTCVEVSSQYSYRLKSLQLY